MKSRAVLILLLFTLTIGWAQTPAPPPVVAGVEGTVLNSVGGDAVRKATVLLQAVNAGAAAVNYATESDGSGRFIIEDIASGEYSLTADRPGFWMQSEGATGAPPPKVKVERGQRVKDLTIRLVPASVISGRVLDEDGEPIRGATVQALWYAYQAGSRQLRNTLQVTTNDAGEYRMFGLRAGTFYLQATVNNRRFSSFGPNINYRGPKPPNAYAPTFFPSATDVASATPIPVGPGAQVAGMDIRFRGEQSYSVRGTLSHQNEGEHHPGYSLQLMPRGGQLPRQGGGWRMANDEFEFPNVAPGAYVLMATEIDGEKRRYARQDVDVVNGDVKDVHLAFAPAADVTGVVRIEGTLSRPLGVMRITLLPELQGPYGAPNAEVQADGTFVLHEVVPAVYLLSGGIGPGTYFKSVKLGDRELPERRMDFTQSTAPISILVGTDVGHLDGTVTKANGEPAIRVRVTLVPQEGTRHGQQQFSRFAFTNEKGVYRVESIPPGEYKVFAWEDVQAGAPQDPVFRKPFENRGVKIKMDSNGTGKADLTVISTEEIKNPPAPKP